MPEVGRLAKVAFLLALAAAFSAWNPVAAPFGLAVGIAAAALSVRAARTSEGRGRRVAAAALVLSGLAAVASAVILVLAAGLGRGEEGPPLVSPRSPAEVRDALDRSEAETREARERAQRELEDIRGERGESPPAPGPAAAPPGRR